MTGVDETRVGRLSPEQLERLLQVGRSLVSELDLEAVLGHVLDAARDLTGARYAALGILDAEKHALERFLFVGVDEETRRQIGPLPRGHGVLGELIREPRTLRLERISDHPRSYGFPAGHPRMATFLGGPVKVRGEVYGNLYLTEKTGGDQFTEEDELLLVILSEWAAVAIDNARSLSTLESRRRELERAVRGLEAITGLNRELERETEAERVLELVVKRGRALVSAKACAVLLTSERGLHVAAVAGDLPSDLLGRWLEGAPWLIAAMRTGGVQRPQGAAVASLLGQGLSATAALVAPLRSRGAALGALVALGDGKDGEAFDRDDELVLGPFATTAAGALAAIRALADERTQLRVIASEQERRRWARELHDETLQELGALKLAQQAAVEVDDPVAAQRSLRGTLERIDVLIEGLEGLITELRPAALDQLGPQAAIESLVARLNDLHAVEITADFDLAYESGREETRLPPELEATVYRLVQEALTNVVKHAEAHHARVAVEQRHGELVVTVEDDGRGLPEESPSRGFGLLGMAERVELSHGELDVGPGSLGGTRVRATLPVSGSDAEP
jgi:signal transduction histidine kinase